MGGLLATIVLVAIGVVAFKLLSRPHTSIALGGGTAALERGAPPPGLVSDLADVMRAAPDARGRVTVSGRGPSLEITVSGLDEGTAQRVRNTVGLYRSRLR